ncbi:hypothetical protein AYO51_15435 [Lactiplantibacillus plantarum]|nr:hypothetical protein AYO51_15435 [Lactiplantibacillus plantarum]KYM70798.1 hypothetical protein AZJ01_17120 [Lactiplantibacillus plantarum]
MKMDEVEKQTCGFCNRDTSIKSIESDEIWYLDPTSGYGKSMRQHNHENVQVDINDSKYPDARPGDSTTAGFWLNYCPGCGQKLE